jgi:hypothetical protein
VRDVSHGQHESRTTTSAIQFNDQGQVISNDGQGLNRAISNEGKPAGHGAASNVRVNSSDFASFNTGAGGATAGASVTQTQLSIPTRYPCSRLGGPGCSTTRSSSLNSRILSAEHRRPGRDRVDHPAGSQAAEALGPAGEYVIFIRRKSHWFSTHSGCEKCSQPPQVTPCRSDRNSQA